VNVPCLTGQNSTHCVVALIYITTDLQYITVLLETTALQSN